MAMKEVNRKDVVTLNKDKKSPNLTIVNYIGKEVYTEEKNSGNRYDYSYGIIFMMSWKGKGILSASAIEVDNSSINLEDIEVTVKGNEVTFEIPKSRDADYNQCIIKYRIFVSEADIYSSEYIEVEVYFNDLNSWKYSKEKST